MTKHFKDTSIMHFYSQPDKDGVDQFDDRTLASLAGMDAAVEEPTMGVDQFISRKFRLPYRSGGSR